MIWYLILLIFVISLGFMAFLGAPYVPSQKKFVRQAFTELYQLSSDDFVVDVGSGDGIVLREASRLGARGLGLEINPLLVLISKLFSRGDKRINFKLANYWLAHLPKATTVVYAFSVTRDIDKMANWLSGEAVRLGKTIYFITYGSNPSHLVAAKSIGAFNLYVIQPLQSDKAQV